MVVVGGGGRGGEREGEGRGGREEGLVEEGRAKDSKAEEVRIAKGTPTAPPAQQKDLELANVREAIFEILGMHRGIVEVAKMIQALQERGIQLGQVQLYWIIQEDPHYTFVPAGSNEEVNIVLVPKFPGQ